MNSKSYIEHEKKIMDMEYDIITEYIKLRKNSNISQEELAKETHVIRTTIARIERNMNSPQLKTMLELLEPLGYTLDIVPLKNK
ncbi:MAG: helix-turn-helix transcriptional regulator [Bacilli bacterium]|nr:helix-turn-helix transcriptional regulator [Bacilli bacterium]